MIRGGAPGIAALALAATSVPSGRAEVPVVRSDREAYSKGSYIAYPAMWCANFFQKEMVKDVDYAGTISLLPSTFPNRSTIRWRVPLKPPTKCGVYGFPGVSFGNYDNGTPQHPVKPIQVRNLRNFRLTYDVAYAAVAGEFNVLAECYLTSRAGKADAKVAEIGFLPHSGASMDRFANRGRQIGTYTDRSKRPWQVSVTGIYYTFVPADRADVLVGTADFRQALNFLRGKGIVSGQEWLNGMAFGVEPVTGSGSLNIRRLAVTFN